MFDIKFIVVNREEDYLQKMKPLIDQFFLQLNQNQVQELPKEMQMHEVFQNLINEMNKIES